MNAGIGGRIFYRPTSEADRIYLCSYRTGRRTPIGWDLLFDAEEVVLTGVSDLAIRGDGKVAWIVEVREEGTTVPTYELRSAAPGAGSVLVAAGPDVVPRSLALAGSTLYWTQAGLPRSAPLP